MLPHDVRAESAIIDGGPSTFNNPPRLNGPSTTVSTCLFILSQQAIVLLGKTLPFVTRKTTCITFKSSLYYLLPSLRMANAISSNGKVVNPTQQATPAPPPHKFKTLTSPTTLPSLKKKNTFKRIHLLNKFLCLIFVESQNARWGRLESQHFERQ